MLINFAAGFGNYKKGRRQALTIICSLVWIRLNISLSFPIPPCNHFINIFERSEGIKPNRIEELLFERWFPHATTVVSYTTWISSTICCYIDVWARTTNELLCAGKAVNCCCQSSMTKVCTNSHSAALYQLFGCCTLFTLDCVGSRVVDVRPTLSHTSR